MRDYEVISIINLVGRCSNYRLVRLQKMSEIGKVELISSDGWPDSYQERKLSNHIAAAQLPEGVVVS
jgi:hypothetical protein